MRRTIDDDRGPGFSGGLLYSLGVTVVVFGIGFLISLIATLCFGVRLEFGL